MLAVLDKFFTVMEDALLMDFNVNTPGINGRVSVKGGFEGQNDSFTPGRNRVEASFTPAHACAGRCSKPRCRSRKAANACPAPWITAT